ncbi:MAG: chemotaxis protein CheW, partial [Gammaproteobacteria bacterium]|nr:chemotaxis protein CheW [Gammaproteobacteria bacterium]
MPCCVDSNTAQIVIEPPAHITAIPGSNAYRPGLMVYAKRTVSIYDVRTKFNLSTEQRGKIIITEMGNQLFGFWVDKIQAVLLSSEGKWQILPTECPKELFEAVFMYNKQLIFKTSFNALTKAQVNTHTQRFINKLLNEEQKSKKQNNEETVSIKDTAQPKTQIETKTKEKIETTEDTPLKQNKPVSTKPAVSPLPKLKTHLKTSGSTKTPAAEKQ